MTPIVSLRAVVEEMDALSDEAHACINKRTHELVTIRDEEITIIERGDDIEDYPEWQQDMIRITRQVLESDDYLHLPSKFDIDEYDIMKCFCDSIENEALRNELHDLIRGSGAFGRFKDAFHRWGIADDWYRFRQAALEEIAVDWLEANNIPYSREDG